MTGALLEKPRQTWGYTWRFHRFVREQHERHGPSFWLRLPGLPDTVVTSDRELIKELFTGDPLVRRHGNDLIAPVLGSGSVMQLEPAEHLVRRKQLLPPFHGDRVRAYGDIVAGLVAADLDTWDGTVRVHPHARALTLDVIFRVVLGSSDAALQAEMQGILDSLDSPATNLGLFAPALTGRWNPVANVYWRRIEHFDALMGRLADRPAGEDSVLAMLQASEISRDDLKDELKTLLTAGHETTASAIGWAADLLAHHPQVVARLREGDRAYTAAVAKEVMRVRTVVPISAGRILLAPLGGLDAGTMVIVDAFSLHSDPELWDEPEAFRPERFLDGQPEPYSYLPFGGGAHRCLGAALATLELEAAIAGMAERFDLEPAGPPAKPARRGVSFIPAGGAPVRIRQRG